MIPSIAIEFFSYENMFCMFCGKQILYADESPQECPHVLFIATTEAGYEYQSDLAVKILPSFDLEYEDEAGSDKSFLERIKETEGLPYDSFIVEICSPAPSLMEVYVGFSSFNE